MGKFEVVILRGCERCHLGFMARKKGQRWCCNACRVAGFQRRKKAMDKLDQNITQIIIDELLEHS